MYIPGSGVQDSGYGQSSYVLRLIIPTKICRLELSGKFPMGLGIPPLKFKIPVESNPPKFRILVRRLAVLVPGQQAATGFSHVLAHLFALGKRQGERALDALGL